MNMTNATFIETANQLGEKGQPFFFLFDYELEKPLVLPLDQAKNNGIYFDILGHTNVDWQVELPSEKLSLTRTPITLEQYRLGFDCVQESLRKGSTTLLNLTYPTKIECNYSLQQIFRACQAKYKLWYENHFVCFSPECFVKIEDDKIFTYPMKGTISLAELNAREQLLGSEKELLEHHGVVDLLKKDLALVADGITVTKFRYIDEVPTNRGIILQTSSEIRGNLPLDWRENIGSLLVKLLPAGSICGAPKAKTYEIIQQAELDKRGYYTGIFGVFDGRNLQSGVLIRYIEQTACGLQFRSGGGITIHSQLDKEYRELIEKVYIPIL